MQKRQQPSETGISTSTALTNASSKPLTRRIVLKGALISVPLWIAAPTLLLPRKSVAASHFGPTTSSDPYAQCSGCGIHSNPNRRRFHRWLPHGRYPRWPWRLSQPRPGVYGFDEPRARWHIRRQLRRIADPPFDSKAEFAK